MRLFLKKFAQFFLLFLILFILISFFEIKFLKDNYIYPLKKENENIFLGHSHSACSINDSIVNNTKNLSGTGESYFYTFLKLKRILNSPNNIKNVFVEFTNNKTMLYYDKNIIETRYIREFLPNYIFLLEKEEFEILLFNNPKGFLLGILDFVSVNTQAILSPKKQVAKEIKWGGFYYNQDNLIDSFLKKDINDIPYQKMNQPLSNYGLNYLDKIIELARQKNKNIFLFRSPMYGNGYNTANEKELQTLLKTRYRHCKFIDFKNFPISKYDYADLLHLNHKGARKFSTYLNKIIVDSLLSQKNLNDYGEQEKEKIEINLEKKDK